MRNGKATITRLQKYFKFLGFTTFDLTNRIEGEAATWSLGTDNSAFK